MQRLHRNSYLVFEFSLSIAGAALLRLGLGPFLLLLDVRRCFLPRKLVSVVTFIAVVAIRVISIWHTAPTKKSQTRKLCCFAVRRKVAMDGLVVLVVVSMIMMMYIIMMLLCYVFLVSFLFFVLATFSLGRSVFARSTDRHSSGFG